MDKALDDSIPTRKPGQAGSGEKGGKAGGKSKGKGKGGGIAFKGASNGEIRPSFNGPVRDVKIGDT